MSDKGPWSVVLTESGWGVSSDDFTHDVLLRVSGDFADKDERRRYCEWLAEKLNSPGLAGGEGKP
jgi:hypothetical protein